MKPDTRRFLGDVAARHPSTIMAVIENGKTLEITTSVGYKCRCFFLGIQAGPLVSAEVRGYPVTAAANMVRRRE